MLCVVVEVCTKGGADVEPVTVEVADELAGDAEEDAEEVVTFETMG